MGQCWAPVDDRMPFKVPHALEKMKFGSVTFCCEVSVYTLIHGGFVMPQAWKQAGLWAVKKKLHLACSKSTTPSGQVRLGY